MQLQAVVDTAAQVTLVSEEFYKSLDPVPPIRKEVVMDTAGKGMLMNGYIVGPFQVVLGTHQFSVEIYVAPIEEDMLLGLDLSNKELDCHPPYAVFEVLISHPWWLPLLYTPLP
jgi:hypothetical protein